MSDNTESGSGTQCVERQPYVLSDCHGVFRKMTQTNGASVPFEMNKTECNKKSASETSSSVLSRDEEDIREEMVISDVPALVSIGRSLDSEDTQNFSRDEEKKMILAPLQMFCEVCTIEKDENNVVQCCEGHIVCQECVDVSTKIEFSQEKNGYVVCPQKGCHSAVPQSELRKVLTTEVIGRLEDSWNNQTSEAIEKMNDIVKCPSCGFAAALDISVKTFKCIQCNKVIRFNSKRSTPYSSKKRVLPRKRKGKQLLSRKKKNKSSTGSRSPSQDPSYSDKDMVVSDAKALVAINRSLETDDANNILGDEEATILPYPQMLCEACAKEKDYKNVVQCCEGHIICKECVAVSAKTEVSEEKRGFVKCPQPECQSSLPQSELRKALTTVLLGLLEDSWKNQATEAIEKMNDIVKCPTCYFSTALDISVKKFMCFQCNEVIQLESETSTPYSSKGRASSGKKKGKQPVSRKVKIKSSTISWKPSQSPGYTEKDMVESDAPGVVSIDLTLDEEDQKNVSVDEENTMILPMILPFSHMLCEACAKEKDHSSVVQCCDGHIICTNCVEISTKAELSEKKKGFVMCPQPGCHSSIPHSELRKALSTIVLDLVEDAWKKQTTEAIEKMNDTVKCPSCKFSAALDADVKRFKCIQCNEVYCRYCEMKWGKRHSHDMCGQTKKWMSRVTGNVINIPAHWTESDYNAEGHLMQEVIKSSLEFQEVAAYMFKYMDVNITNIYRIQNERLWEKYSLTKCHMIADLGQYNINEMRLFHGTNTDVIEAICKEGFDWRLCGKNGTSYGQGTYFARHPQLSHKYSSAGSTRWIVTNWKRPVFTIGSVSATKPNSWFTSGTSTATTQVASFGYSGTATNTMSSGSSFNAQNSGNTSGTPQSTSMQAWRGDGEPSEGSGTVSGQSDFSDTGDYFMFLARVLLGRSCLGSSQMRRPEKDRECRETHSAVDKEHNPRIFVVFDNTQCYPEYLIQYSTQEL